MKFDEKDSVSGVQQLKSSVQKSIRSKLLELYPYLESHIDQIIPKKDSFRLVKCHDHIEIMVNDPFFLPVEQVDKGAIKFVLSGANIMCPGLTSKGAKMTQVSKGTAVMAEGKQHALAVGVTTLSTEDIAKINKGVGVENCHYLNDDSIEFNKSETVKNAYLASPCPSP
ncbi:Similar to MCTS1: Malignant T-cell-amplified sequence 1 homolog (Drosophila melanogaster) [Cotesia congregata]|uniref:Similar to MCTS1: Malignant T-cell-amplified sequence 1 homolog (Drosophila melanogaster) n=1 Tax=Cotesia congregata TaxID=51543 RepID=A0A8J2MXL7_COTCN|nr:Similar to MCTS1: Malignant T-cell-amplified sequence 1 homolog (Drosophila melanogaster) [Cotesia congregata]